VEVIKLSLLLKVLEGETQQTIEPLFRIFHERALPDLGSNIKCGNSLIGIEASAPREVADLSTAACARASRSHARKSLWRRGALLFRRGRAAALQSDLT
jgi:hypothetical protein